MEMKRKKDMKKLKAFSLNEVLVVLVIVGILSSVAIVSFGDFVGDAYRTEAQTNLKAIKVGQGLYKSTKFKYSNSLKEIRFTPPKLESEGGSSVYRYEITEATTTSFKATATAVNDYDGDGVYEVLTISNESEKSIVTVED